MEDLKTMVLRVVFRIVANCKFLGVTTNILEEPPASIIRTEGISKP
jgi:hypothetical protein